MYKLGDARSLVGRSITPSSRSISKTPLYSNAQVAHTEVTVRLLDITDAGGNTVKNGVNLYDPKKFSVIGNKKTLFRFVVENQPAEVTIRVIPHKNNTAAKKYYKTPHYVIQLKRSVNPGVHTLAWDGRGKCDGRRYILQGEYMVQVFVKCGMCGKLIRILNQKALKVKKPYVFAYEPRSYSWSAYHVEKKLIQLPDGTGSEIGPKITEAAAHKRNMAKYALEKMQQSAVWFFAGHGYLDGIVFDDIPKPNWTYIQPRYIPGGRYSVVSRQKYAEVDSLAGNALEDVFLVVLLCCHTGRFPREARDHYAKLPKSLIAKGVDLVLAFEGEIKIPSYRKWTANFLAALCNRGASVQEAAEFAASRVESKYQAEFKKYKLFYGAGASPNEKFLPLRYGRKSRLPQTN